MRGVWQWLLSMLGWRSVDLASPHFPDDCRQRIWDAALGPTNLDDRDEAEVDEPVVLDAEGRARLLAGFKRELQLRPVTCNWVGERLWLAKRVMGSGVVDPVLWIAFEARNEGTTLRCQVSPHVAVTMLLTVLLGAMAALAAVIAFHDALEIFSGNAANTIQAWSNLTDIFSIGVGTIACWIVLRAFARRKGDFLLHFVSDAARASPTHASDRVLRSGSLKSRG